jgi:hexosaminidase
MVTVTSHPIGSRVVAALAAAALVGALALTSALPGSGKPGGSCHPDADDLFVTHQPVDHSADATFYRARLVLENRDTRCELGSSGWQLLFSFVRQPLAVYPPGALGDAARQQIADQGLSVARADEAQSGDYYALMPTSDFAPVEPGERRTITLDAEYWSLAKTDAPAGWHIVFDGEPARWVPTKALHDPTDPNQTTAFSGDRRPVQTSATRFAENTTPLQSLSLQDTIVPRPLEVTTRPGDVTINGKQATIRYEPTLRREATYLESALEDVLRGDVRLREDGHGRGSKIAGLSPSRDHSSGSEINLTLDPRLDVDQDGESDSEGYTLRVSSRGIHIVGSDHAGLFYGIQTLRQLIPVSAYEAAATGHKQRELSIRRATIADAPLFGYRGMHIDVARHFETPATVMKFLDLMAFLKLNSLHFHVTDDEGWRVEIPGLPELTSYGAQRGFDLDEDTMMHQAMGSSNDLRRGDNIRGKPDNETEANLGRTPAYQGFEQATVNFVGEGNGYYTTRQFQDILRYADARHIQVIPELDFPAHARAAVQSMETRYERFKDSDPVRANQYRLLDPNDTSHHVSVQYYTDNLANPCIETTYAFLTKVVTEVRALYDAAGVTLPMINLGGDEPPGPDRWQSSPKCQSNPDTAGLSDLQLMDYFFSRFHKIALTVAPRTSGWEDILLHTPGFTLENFVPLPWQNVWGWGREQVAYQFANDGIPVILAHSTNLYMDLAYNKDPDEPGYYWANYVDEKSTFTYQPFNVYANATHDRWGAPFTPDPAWEQLTPEGKENILGLEALLWAENGKTPEIREYQAFPKLLGAAERAWNQNTPTPEEMPQAWDVFANTLGQVTFPLLSHYQPVGLQGVGVNYRIPLPGGDIDGGVLTANVRNPGMAIQYSLDGRHWSDYKRPVRVGPSALIRTRAVDGRTSRFAPVDVPPWTAGSHYGAASLVTYQGEIYRAARAHTSRTAATPDLTPRLWKLVQ